jgi:ribonucleoside-triphosphate reductase
MTPEELKTIETQRTPCEVYSRVVGYIRPVNQWNDGKKAEFEDRLGFEVKKV